MRTAIEMYENCVVNGYGMGQNKKWALKHFAIIEKALSNDEKVLMCFIGLHNYISPTKHDQNYAYAVTSKRIMMAQQRVVGQNFQSIMLSNLNDVSMRTGIVFGTITIDTIKEKFNVGVAPVIANKINESIHDILYSLHQSSNSREQIAATTQTISIADEVLKCKNLLDIGAISEDEFNELKRSLIK